MNRKYFILYAPYEKKLRLLLFIFASFVNIFFTSCDPKDEIISSSHHKKAIPVHLKVEEKKWIEKFFQDLFLDPFHHNMVYTLFGTKPMSSVTIYDFTQEDWEQAKKLGLEREPYKSQSEKIKRQLIKQNEEMARTYDLNKNWEKWLSFIDQYPHSPFLFRTQEIPNESPGKIYLGYMINIQEVVWILKRYYEDFKNEIGRDFSPIEEALDFSNPISSFWEEVFSNSYLLGLLYGFGEKNSYFFNEAKKYDNFFDSRIFGSPDLRSSIPHKSSISHLALPCWRYYTTSFNVDPIKIKYEKERETIQAHVNDENFFEMAINQLVGNLHELLPQK